MIYYSFTELVVEKRCPRSVLFSVSGPFDLNYISIKINVEIRGTYSPAEILEPADSLNPNAKPDLAYNKIS